MELQRCGMYAFARMATLPWRPVGQHRFGFVTMHSHFSVSGAEDILLAATELSQVQKAVRVAVLKVRQSHIDYYMMLACVQLLLSALTI
jgi:amino acid permease